MCSASGSAPPSRTNSSIWSDKKLGDAVPADYSLHISETSLTPKKTIDTCHLLSDFVIWIISHPSDRRACICASAIQHQQSRKKRAKGVTCFELCGRKMHLETMQGDVSLRVVVSEINRRKDDLTQATHEVERNRV